MPLIRCCNSTGSNAAIAAVHQRQLSEVSIRLWAAPVMATCLVPFAVKLTEEQRFYTASARSDHGLAGSKTK